MGRRSLKHALRSEAPGHGRCHRRPIGPLCSPLPDVLTSGSVWGRFRQVSGSGSCRRGASTGQRDPRRRTVAGSQCPGSPKSPARGSPRKSRGRAATWAAGNRQDLGSRLLAGPVGDGPITPLSAPWLGRADPARSAARRPLGSSSWPQGDHHEVFSTGDLARRIACPWVGWCSRCRHQHPDDGWSGLSRVTRDAARFGPGVPAWLRWCCHAKLPSA